MTTRTASKEATAHASKPFFSAQSARAPAFFSPPAVQAKLTIGEVGDPFEREADAMADRVVQRKLAGGATDKGAPSLQPKCAGCQGEEEEQVQRRESPGALDAGHSVPEGVQQSLEGSRGGGDSMPANLRDEMETAFEADLSGVRIHTGADSAQLNQQLSARAFTHGSDIYFNSGEFQPQSTQGRHLLAHELAHVMQQGGPAIQRKDEDAKAKDDECPKPGQPGSASAKPEDKKMGPSGSYYIYGRLYQKGTSVADYCGEAIELWLPWRFGKGLSSAVANRIRSETRMWNWEWDPREPTPGCQSFARMSIDSMNRLVRLADRDAKARPAEAKEKKAGLPELPDPVGFGADEEIVVYANPPANAPAPAADPNAAAGGTPKAGADPAPPKSLKAQAEEALDPTSIYNKGAATATDPPFPMSIDGPEMEVPSGLGIYTARLHYERVTGDPFMQMAYGMNYVTYYWEVFNITDMLMRGMSMGSSMLQEAKRVQSVSQDLGQSDQAAAAADGAGGQHAKNAVDQLSSETMDALRELRHPVDAAAGGSAIDVVTRAYANVLNLELLPASAIVAAGGWLVGELATLLGGYSREKEISFPKTEGYYMVRCIAVPSPRGPNNSEVRAASVRAKIVEVGSAEKMAKNALGMADAAIANLELQKAMTSDAAMKARFDLQIANIKEQSSGDLVKYLTRIIEEKEAEKKRLPTWRQNTIQREIDSLKLRLEQVTSKRAGTGDVHLRPQVVFTSTVTGDTYPLMLELSPMPLLAADGSERADRKKVRLFDATVPDREKIDREGATLEEAVTNAFEIFRKSGVLGPGILFVRMPADWTGTKEFKLTVNATGGAAVRKRLEDLATVLLVLSMAVPGVGEISVAIAAGLAAERLISKALNGTFRLTDPDTIGDMLAILGAVAQGAQLVGQLRVVSKGEAFVGALRTAESAALEKAAAELASAIKVGKIANATSMVVNAGGLIWGNLAMINELAKIQAEEMAGTIPHTEAAKRRASLLTNAILNNGIMLHGLMKPQGADRAGVPPERAKIEPPPRENLPPKGPGEKPGENAPKSTELPKQTPAKPAETPQAKNEAPPETIPEQELEKRANAPESPAVGGKPAVKKKDDVRTRFRTPDNLHEIFILEDGRIFRCSLSCAQLRDWYGAYLARQPAGSRQQRATELGGQLEVLEARAKSGEKTPALDQAIGALDVAMREFIAPDLARELQVAFEARPGAKAGEKFLAESQVRELLKFFNLDEIMRFTAAGGLEPTAVRGLVEVLGEVDRQTAPADRAALRPVLDQIVAGGEGATRGSDFLHRLAAIQKNPEIKFTMKELVAAHENGDAILAKKDLQSGVRLENDVKPYELKDGRLVFGGKEGGMPKKLFKPPYNLKIDFVIIRTEGGSFEFVLGLEHTGLSGARASVFGAGQLTVNAYGFVTRIDGRSGHYLPSEANVRRSAQFFIDRGVLLDPQFAKDLGMPNFEINPTF